MTRKLAATAWSSRKPIDQGGLLKFVFGKEYHAFNPDVINSLHKAVRSGKYEDFKEYAELVNNRPVATIRDLFKLKQLIRSQLNKLNRLKISCLVSTRQACL